MPDLAVAQDATSWDSFVSGASDASVLQSWGWGELKARYGWSVARYFWLDGAVPRCAISVLRRPLPGGLALHYAPRGPILDGRREEWPALWRALKRRLRQEGGTLLKVDPEWPGDQALFESVGGRLSPYPIQHQASFILDISWGEAVLKRMKESTRRNIRLGQRAGIRVEASDTADAMDTFYELLKESADRHRFAVRPRAYYQDFLSIFREKGQAAVYLAQHAGEPVAGAVMLFYERKLNYLYGGTSRRGRELKPGYLLHWQAIQDAQQRGCTVYDLWGIPLRPTPDHAGYGFYVFKSRFNGQRVRYVGAYDLPVRQPLSTALLLAQRLVRATKPEFAV